MSHELHVVLRLVAAVAVGLAIGLNRDMQQKALGMRTLAMVSLGAAIVTIATLEYAKLNNFNPDAESRVLQGIIQGVLTGIGFIGAGVILHNQRQQQVHGLTTATTVWVTAALGIACAISAWWLTVAGTVLAIFVLFVLGKVEARFMPDK